jgi:hypothetical protein
MLNAASIFAITNCCGVRARNRTARWEMHLTGADEQECAHTQR